MTWKKKREGGVSVAARLIGNRHFHFGEHFVKAIVLVQIGRGIDGEWGVSVCVLSCLLSVDIHFYMLIDTFKVEFHQFCSGGLEGACILLCRLETSLRLCWWLQWQGWKRCRCPNRVVNLQ